MSLLASALVAHMPVALLGFNLEDILISTGPWVLVVSAIIVFIESGVLFPVLPGDSLIFALGMLHDRMGLSLWLAFPVLIVAAVAVVAGLATLIVLQLISSSVDIDTLCADAAAFLFLALFAALIFAFLLRARRLIKR